MSSNTNSCLGIHKFCSDMNTFLCFGTLSHAAHVICLDMH